jgi:hypothetical protein
MTILDVIKEQISNFDHIDVNPIFDVNKKTIGWNCIAYLSDGFPISGGTHINKDTALRVCVAEALERTFFYKISRNKLASEFLIKEFPTTCGFACGFEEEKTRYRAICEALERWAWSKWIDDGCNMPAIHNPKIDILSETLANNFVKRSYFLKSFNFQNLKLQLGIFIGETQTGVFAGSRVCTSNEDPWGHAIVEAFRNFRNFEVSKISNINLANVDIVRLRAIYFGTHKNDAWSQIENAKKMEWPEPSIRLLRKYDTQIPDVYLWRCILNDWISWYDGDETRFVY